MSKPASLGRLREISKQKSIRRPLLVLVTADMPGNSSGAPATKVEWPVPN